MHHSQNSLSSSSSSFSLSVIFVITASISFLISAFSLSHKKAGIRKLIEAVITNMMDNEEEEEAKENSENDAEE